MEDSTDDAYEELAGIAAKFKPTKAQLREQKRKARDAALEAAGLAALAPPEPAPVPAWSRSLQQASSDASAPGARQWSFVASLHIPSPTVAPAKDASVRKITDASLDREQKEIIEAVNSGKSTSSSKPSNGSGLSPLDTSMTRHKLLADIDACKKQLAADKKKLGDMKVQIDFQLKANPRNEYSDSVINKRIRCEELERKIAKDDQTLAWYELNLKSPQKKPAEKKTTSLASIAQVGPITTHAKSNKKILKANAPEFKPKNSPSKPVKAADVEKQKDLLAPTVASTVVTKKAWATQPPKMSDLLKDNKTQDMSTPKEKKTDTTEDNRQPKDAPSLKDFQKETNNMDSAKNANESSDSESSDSETDDFKQPLTVKKQRASTAKVDTPADAPKATEKAKAAPKPNISSTAALFVPTMPAQMRNELQGLIPASVTPRSSNTGSTSNAVKRQSSTVNLAAVAHSATRRSRSREAAKLDNMSEPEDNPASRSSKKGPRSRVRADLVNRGRTQLPDQQTSTSNMASQSRHSLTPGNRNGSGGDMDEDSDAYDGPANFTSTFAHQTQDEVTGQPYDMRSGSPSIVISAPPAANTGYTMPPIASSYSTTPGRAATSGEKPYRSQLQGAYGNSYDQSGFSTPDRTLSPSQQAFYAAQYGGAYGTPQAATAFGSQSRAASPAPQPFDNQLPNSYGTVQGHSASAIPGRTSSPLSHTQAGHYMDAYCTPRYDQSQIGYGNGMYQAQMGMGSQPAYDAGNMSQAAYNPTPYLSYGQAMQPNPLSTGLQRYAAQMGPGAHQLSQTPASAIPKHLQPKAAGQIKSPQPSKINPTAPDFVSRNSPQSQTQQPLGGSFVEYLPRTQVPRVVDDNDPSTWWLSAYELTGKWEHMDPSEQVPSGAEVRRQRLAAQAEEAAEEAAEEEAKRKEIEANKAAQAKAAAELKARKIREAGETIARARARNIAEGRPDGSGIPTIDSDVIINRMIEIHCGPDSQPLLELLGKPMKVDPVETRKFMAAFEQQIKELASKSPGATAPATNMDGLMETLTIAAEENVKARLALQHAHKVECWGENLEKLPPPKKKASQETDSQPSQAEGSGVLNDPVSAPAPAQGSQVAETCAETSLVNGAITEEIISTSAPTQGRGTDAKTTWKSPETEIKDAFEHATRQAQHLGINSPAFPRTAAEYAGVRADQIEDTKARLEAIIQSRVVARESDAPEVAAPLAGNVFDDGRTTVLGKETNTWLDPNSLLPAQDPYPTVPEIKDFAKCNPTSSGVPSRAFPTLKKAEDGNLYGCKPFVAIDALQDITGADIDGDVLKLGEVRALNKGRGDAAFLPPPDTPQPVRTLRFREAMAVAEAKAKAREAEEAKALAEKGLKPVKKYDPLWDVTAEDVENAKAEEAKGDKAEEAKDTTSHKPKDDESEKPNDTESQKPNPDKAAEPKTDKAKKPKNKKAKKPNSDKSKSPKSDATTSSSDVQAEGPKLSFRERIQQLKKKQAAKEAEKVRQAVMERNRQDLLARRQNFVRDTNARDPPNKAIHRQWCLENGIEFEWNEEGL